MRQITDNLEDSLIDIKRLAHDSEYYTNVFKRVEKVVSVILFLVSNINKKDKDFYLTLIRDKGLKIHEISLACLRLQAHEVSDGLLELQFTLVELESTMRLLEAATAVPPPIADMVYEQLFTLERYLKNNYLNVDKKPEIKSSSSAGSRQLSPAARQISSRRKVGVNIPKGDISSEAYLVHSHLNDRSERIKTVLEAKPQATIKDIAEIITDVSEKTIQRELNSLIEKGQVIREGERRWSRYSVVK